MDRINNMKRRLRKLKALEVRLRWGGKIPPGAALVWDAFFDLHSPPRGWARHSLAQLAGMDAAAYRAAVDAYLAHLYQALYTPCGEGTPACDPARLARLGLPPSADAAAVKRRFRQLALQAHPDTGGSNAAFRALMDDFEGLL